MTNGEAPSGRSWDYRFLLPGEAEIEQRQLDGDAAAETRARELAAERKSPIVIERHSAHVDAWEYVTEVG